MITEMKTKFEEFVQDAGRHRIFEQESLAIEATELISTMLKEQQVTKTELAKRIGKSKAYVTQLLSGARNMTLHTFADLAFALGYKVELHALSLAKPSAVVVYKNRVQIRSTFHRRAPHSWGLGTTVPSSADGDFCLGDAAHAA